MTFHHLERFNAFICFNAFCFLGHHHHAILSKKLCDNTYNKSSTIILEFKNYLVLYSSSTSVSRLWSHALKIEMYHRELWLAHKKEGSTGEGIGARWHSGNRLSRREMATGKELATVGAMRERCGADRALPHCPCCLEMALCRTRQLFQNVLSTQAI